MTNREAIEILKIEREHMTPTLLMELIEAMDVAISALQAQDVPDTNVGDILSRQSLIDSFKYDDDGTPWTIDDVIYRLEQFPSVKEESSDVGSMIYRQAAIDVVDSETVSTNPEHFKSSEKFIKFMDDADIASFGKWQWANGFNTALTAVDIDLKKLPSAQPEWSNYTVACLLAELFDDPCACNYNGIDEWLPEKCEVIDACPNPVGVACWEQYLKHRAERRADERTD